VPAITALTPIQPRRGALLASLAVATFAGAAQAGDPAPALRDLAPFIEKGLVAWDTPGLVLTVVRGDEVTLEAGYGLRRTGRPERMDARTRVGIGSTSKAFGAAAIAHLVDQGKLSWDDRVVDHLPGFRLSDPWVTRDVRIRDILAQRVGLDLVDENRLFAVSMDTSDFLRRVGRLPLALPFRSNYLYSNAMFTTAGEVVAAVSGERWDAYLQRTIWAPLGMAETGANLDAALAAPNHATAHVKVGAEIRALPGWEPERVIFEQSGPSGAVISTAHDMAQWLRLQLGAGRHAGRRIIREDTFREMHVPHSPMRGSKGATSWFRHLTASELKIDADQSYALGWRVSRYRGRPMIWHGGTVSGFRTVVAFLPEERIAVFVNGNRESLLPMAVALTVFDAHLGVADADWSAKFLEERRLQEAEAQEQDRQLAASRITGTRPSLALPRYAGNYADDGTFGSLEVRGKGRALSLKLGARSGSLEHWHLDRFRIHWDGLVPEEGFVSFTIDRAGTPSEIELGGIGRFTRREPQHGSHTGGTP
jgi:CubicO group peptidase (beta-lactamase class C family)